MENDDLIDIPASRNCDGETGNEVIANPVFEHVDIETDKVGSGNEDGEILLTADIRNINSTSVDVNSVDETMEVEENVNVKENVQLDLSEEHAENGCRIAKESHKRDGNATSYDEEEESYISWAKKARIAEPRPSVNITYSSLTRESREKLEELLQQWSQWHVQNYSPSLDSDELLESGNKTFFPALRVALHQPSGLSFWMDNQSTAQQSKEIYTISSDSVPLYDRGFSLALNSSDGYGNLEMKLDAVDSSRCFNCNSYGHSLKDCPKPRNNAAVTKARKQHMVKRNVNPSSRNVNRYYQNASGGKFDGLRPGELSAETRRLLGLGELDPPPWLRRMRELGYPPGYLDPNIEDEPSGISIFCDDENIKEETEDGEIHEEATIFPAVSPPLKMTIEFPGINSPIPQNADEWKWGSRVSIPDSSGSHNDQRRFRTNVGGYNYDNSPSNERGRWSPSAQEEEGELQRRKTPVQYDQDYKVRDDERWADYELSKRHHSRRRR